MERSIADESKQVAEKQAIIAKLKQAVSDQTKEVERLENQLSAAKAENAAKDARMSQLQEQMRSGVRQMDEQVCLGRLMN